MLKNRRGIWGSLLILFLVSTCTFELEEEYFNESVVEVNNIDGINTSLKEFQIDELLENDTIFFWEEKRFLYEVNTPNGETVTRIEAFIDGQSVTFTTGTLLSMNLDPSDFGTGFYELQIVYLVRTGSGSLADQTGLEVLAYDQKYVLAIDLDPPNEVPIMSTEIVNGFVTPTWGKYDRVNFQEYRLKKYCSDFVSQNNTLGECGLFIIDDQNITSFPDSAFMQGGVRYSVNVIAARQESIGPLSPELVIPIGDTLEIKGRSDGNYEFTWGKPTLEATLGRYDLYERDVFPNPIIFTSTNVHDTSFVFESDDIPGFGSTYRLNTIPIKIGSGNPLSSQTLEVSIGADIDSYGGFISSQFHNSIYQTSTDKTAEDGYLYKVNINSLERIDSIRWSDIGIPQNDSKKEIFISEDGLRLFIINGVNLFELNPTDLSLVNSITLSTYDDSEYIPKVSSTGILIYASGARTRALDLNTGNLINITDNFLGSDEDADISEDGKYLLINSYIYEFDGTEYIQNSRINLGIYHARFIDNTRIVAHRFRNETYVYNVLTEEIEVLFQDDEFYMDKYGQYDPFSNSLYFIEGRITSSIAFINVLNLDDLSKTEFRVQIRDIRNPYFYQMVNSRLFWQEGKYLDEY